MVKEKYYQGRNMNLLKFVVASMSTKILLLLVGQDNAGFLVGLTSFKVSPDFEVGQGNNAGNYEGTCAWIEYCSASKTYEQK